MTTENQPKDADEWIVWRLADDKQAYGENAGKIIITTKDGEAEICGVVYDEAHARVMAKAPQLLAALKALHAAVITGGDVAFSWPNVYAGIVIDQAETGVVANARPLPSVPKLLEAIEAFVAWWDEWTEADDPGGVEDPDIEAFRDLAAQARRGS